MEAMLNEKLKESFGDEGNDAQCSYVNININTTCIDTLEEQSPPSVSKTKKRKKVQKQKSK